MQSKPIIEITAVNMAKAERLESLNSLRGIAALLVAIDHSILLTNSPPVDSLLFYFATFMGAFGVGAFFLLSGFVIFLSLEKTPPLQFLIQRVFRIYPVIIAAVFLRLVSQIFIGIRDLDVSTIKLFVLNISLFGNLFIPIEANIEPIVWSLSIEVKFYILMAVVFFVARSKMAQRLYPCLVLVTLGLGVLGANFPLLSKPALIDLALAVSCIPILLMGTAVCLFYKKAISLNKLFVLVALLLVVFSFSPISDNVSFYKNFTTWILAAFAFGLCVFSPRMNKVVNKKWLLWLGAISYPLYAIHSTVIELMIHLSPGSTPSALVLRSLVISLVVAYVLHLFIEMPVQAWSKRLTKKKVATLVAS